MRLTVGSGIELRYHPSLFRIPLTVLGHSLESIERRGRLVGSFPGLCDAHVFA